MTKEEVEKFVDEMIADDDKKIIVDPPSGWRYGFPKPYFKNKIEDSAELNAWLVKEGYPQREIDVFEGKLPVRYWYE